MMKILIVGTEGFVAKNLLAQFMLKENVSLLSWNIEEDESSLEEYCKLSEKICIFCDEKSENVKAVWNALNKGKNIHSIICIYKRKQDAVSDEINLLHGGMTAKVCRYFLPEIFGKWCEVWENNLVAELCRKLIRKEECSLPNDMCDLQLAYVDDVVEELWNLFKDTEAFEKVKDIFSKCTYQVTGRRLTEVLKNCSIIPKTLMLPDMLPEGLEKRLYSTYLSYLSENQFAYPLTMHKDERGSFTEVFKSIHGGQISVNVSKPGMEKGNHWHHTKHEKFVVVSGYGRVCFRKYGCEAVYEYKVSSEKMEVIDVPPGYTHSIINDGETDMVTLMWCNECFCPQNPDTIYEKVDKDGE